MAFAAVSAATVVLLFLSTPAAALDVAVPHVEAGHLWDLGYLGQGVEIGVIDLFLANPNHAAISGNHLGSENFANGASFLGAHATQVTGAAVSQDTTFRGVAPEAGWWTAQTTNRGTIASVRRQTLAAETFAQGLRGLNGNPAEVITLSIGVAGDGAATDQWSLALDHIVNTNGRTVTVAAGNDGPGGGTVVGSPHGTFNAIIVGATGTTAGAPSEDYGNVAVFSSRGPTIDGRSKPDIVAPGSLLHLPGMGGGWSDVNGTSFAAPMVAGAAALLIDMGQDLGYTTDPRVVKSVLLNSADKLTGWTHTPTQPLDHDQGAGQLNFREAHLQYLPGGHDPGTVPDVGWDQHDVAGAVENFYSIDGWIAQGQDVTATLAWDRIVTTDVEDVDEAIYSFDHLDNLDLFLYRSDDLTTAVAGSISAVDNVEHLHHAVAAAGAYVLGVRITGGWTHW